MHRSQRLVTPQPCSASLQTNNCCLKSLAPLELMHPLLQLLFRLPSIRLLLMPVPMIAHPAWYLVMALQCVASAAPTQTSGVRHTLNPPMDVEVEVASRQMLFISSF